MRRAASCYFNTMEQKNAYIEYTLTAGHKKMKQSLFYWTRFLLYRTLPLHHNCQPAGGPTFPEKRLDEKKMKNTPR